MLYVKRFLVFLVIFLFCLSTFASAQFDNDEDLLGKWIETVESDAVPGGSFTYYFYFSDKLYDAQNPSLGYKFNWLPGTSGEEKGYYSVSLDEGIITMVSVYEYEEESYIFEFYYDISYDAEGPALLELYPVEGNPAGEWFLTKVK